MSAFSRLSLAVSALQGRSEARSVNEQYALGLTDWADFGGLLMGGYPIQLGLNQTLGGKQLEIQNTLSGLIQGAYRSNSVVAACMLTRLSIFTEARFQYQRVTGGRPGDLWGDASLGILEHPWPGATTGDLLGRAITFHDLTGNNFTVKRRSRLVVPRPDWMTIVLGSPNDPGVEMDDLDAEVLAYWYHPGGHNSGRAPVYLEPSQVSHFMPVPDPLAPWRGMSWLTSLTREIMADSAATAHKLAYFENGATVNMAISLDPGIGLTAFEQWIAAFEAGHKGAANAYKTLYLGAGAKPVPIGSDFQQLDFKVTQGAGETRIAAVAGVHPVIVGLSEGLQGSSLNAGNFQSARRLVADRTIRPLWRNMAGSLETIVPPPGGSRLWFDDRDISFLREDRKDAADIEFVKAQSIRQLVDAGYEPETVVKAVEAEDMGLLRHSGLYSVQLQPPRTADQSPTPLIPTLPPGNGKTPALTGGTP